MSDLFEYEILVEKALRGVVRTALEQVRDTGLVDDHHFFITFHTDYDGVMIPDYLREKYPDEMTIVLQYQFEELVVDEDAFSISLSFNNVPERMTIPFEAITGFADPSVKFGLQFHVDIEELEDLEAAELEGYLEDELMEGFSDDTPDDSPDGGGKKSPKKKGKKGGDQDNVVSLDHFRKT